MTNQLKKIRSNFEVDYELKIKELEKENAYLTIQNNKLKKENAKLSQKPFFEKRQRDIKSIAGNKPESHAKTIVALKDKVRDLIRRLKDVQAAQKKTKANLRAQAERYTFLSTRLIEKHGKAELINLMNHVDCPDKALLADLRRYKGDANALANEFDKRKNKND